MTCAEFQAVLPYIIDNGGKPEEQEHLRSCAVCSDLVADLKYIAEQAKLLVPMMEPRKQVWDGIKSSLQREGLVKDSSRGRLLSSTARTRWGPAGWTIPIAALVLLGAGLLLYRNNLRNGSPEAATTAPASSVQTPASDAAALPVEFASMDGTQDQQILSEVATHAPDLSESYRQNLQTVNAYIADARGFVARDPDNAEARQALMAAYQQKAMLYTMAMRHSLP